MNQQEIDAAERRLREVYANNNEWDVYHGPNSPDSVLINWDEATLAKAYIALMDAKRAEEAERGLAVTYKWLISMGFFSTITARTVIASNDAGDISVSTREKTANVVVNNPTRGQVLDLLKALGVGVKL